jgi:prostaglandin-endoperoxide synthase 2
MDKVFAVLIWLAKKLAARWRWFRYFLNGFLINRIVGSTRTRPHPWSTRDDYVSWSGLTDRSFSARHLPPEDIADLPPVDDVIALFRAPRDPEDPKREQQRLCPKSTCLFPAFAQYLTDGFIRTEIANDFFTETTTENRKKNTSNHEIDLSPLYGRTWAQTLVLRTLSEAPDKRGKLKSEVVGGEEWPLRLFLPGGAAFDPQFCDASGKPILDTPLGIDHSTPEGRESMFAVGGDRANAIVQVSMINALFLREHNRLAGLLAAKHPHWLDERVFQTARNSVIFMFIKIVVEDYINHINGSGFALIADPSIAWRARWSRPNWITAEFSLLYRWHSLIPASMKWNGETIRTVSQSLSNVALLERGMVAAFADVSANRATELGLHNTADFLMFAEDKAVNQARINRIAPFARYWNAFGRKKSLTAFDQITPDAALRGRLKELYGSAQRMEFYAGLFAEARSPDSPLPGLLGSMVAVDAFSQALTNPLLSEHVWGDEVTRVQTFDDIGIAAIEATGTLRDVLARNAHLPDEVFVGMTRQGWEPGAE